MSNSEKEASFRRTGRIASGVTIGLALVALILAIRGDQVPASIALTFALLGLGVTWLSYRRYQALRDDRWQQELAGTEADLADLLTPAPSPSDNKKADNPEESPVA